MGPFSWRYSITAITFMLDILRNFTHCFFLYIHSNDHQDYHQRMMILMLHKHTIAWLLLTKLIRNYEAQLEGGMNKIPSHLCPKMNLNIHTLKGQRYTGTVPCTYHLRFQLWPIPFSHNSPVLLALRKRVTWQITFFVVLYTSLIRLI